jgi:hypothetical protein
MTEQLDVEVNVDAVVSRAARWIRDRWDTVAAGRSL